jgi:hypothetical protein
MQFREQNSKKLLAIARTTVPLVLGRLEEKGLERFKGIIWYFCA